jgi:hypothetical protein
VARVLLYGVAAVVALLLIGADFVWRHTEDAPPGGAPDLAAEPPAGPAKPNGFTALERAADAMVWPEEEWGETWLKDCIEEGDCPTAELARLLARNERALALLETAIAIPAFHSPPMRTVADDMPNMLRWLRLAQLLALRSVREARAGEVGALDSAVAVIRLGHRMQADPSAVLIHAMIGLNVKSTGLRAFVTAARRLEPTRETSLRLSRELEGLRTDPEAWRAMWSTEYRVMSRSGGEIEMPGHLRWLPEAYAYHPNASWGDYADWIRAFRAIAGRPCSALPPTSPALTSRARRLFVELAPNGIGRINTAKGVENLASYEMRRCGADTRLAAAQVVLALRAYESASEALPERLEALVPRFLDALPVEWFHGESLGHLYFREERQLSWLDIELIYPPKSDVRPTPQAKLTTF